MWMCVWVCVSVCVWMCVWMCVWVCVSVCMNVCVYVCVCVCECVYVCVCVCVSVWMCVCMNVCVSVCVWVCECVGVSMCMCVVLLYNILKCSWAILPLGGSEVRHKILNGFWLFVSDVCGGEVIRCLTYPEKGCILCVCCEQPLPTAAGSEVTVRSVLLAWLMTVTQPSCSLYECPRTGTRVFRLAHLLCLLSHLPTRVGHNPPSEQWWLPSFLVSVSFSEALLLCCFWP